jgi:hypothetical protein
MARLLGPGWGGAILALSLVAQVLFAAAEMAQLEPKCNAWPTDAETLYTAGETPTNRIVKNASPLVLGHKMSVSVSGLLKAVRYYKSSMDTGSELRYGRVYAWPSGEMLASTEGFDATGCQQGWVTIPLRKPLQLATGKIYVLAIDTLRYYVRSTDFFFTHKSRGALTFLHGGALYSRTPDCMPTNNKGISASTSYWIDGAYSCMLTWGFKDRPHCRASPHVQFSSPCYSCVCGLFSWVSGLCTCAIQQVPMWPMAQGEER